MRKRPVAGSLVLSLGQAERKECSQFYRRKPCWFLASLHLHPARQSVRSDLRQDALTTLFACAIAVGENPDATRLPHERKDDACLFLTACRPHRRNDAMDARLGQPPDTRESLYHYQVFRWSIDSVRVVKKEGFAKFVNHSFSSSLPRKLILRIFLGDCLVIHNAASIADKFSLSAVQRDCYPVSEETSRAVAESEARD